MSDRRRASRQWTTYALGATCVAAIAAAVAVVGPSNAASGGSGERLVTVARGVVQTTVSGSGSLQAAKQLDLDFESGGTLQKVYVKPGQHVVQGQLLAQLDPTDAQKALDDAEQALAEAQSGSGSSTTTASYEGATGTAATATYATIADAGGAPTTPETTTTPPPTSTTPPMPTAPGPTETAPQTTTTPAPPGTTPQTTTTPAPPATTRPQQTTPGDSAGAGGAVGGGTPGGGGAASGGGAANGGGAAAAGGGAAGGNGTSSGGAASAATIDDLQDAVDEAEAALAATKLRAPMAGTIASVGASAGEDVGGGASSGSSSDSGSASSSGSTSGAGAGGATSGDTSGASSSASASSSAFVVLVDLDAMNLVVPFSESDVGSVRRGQAATVTVNALPDEQVAAHVVSVATLPTTNNSVVSYDVTLRLDQLADGLKAGMTASASVVVEQAEGVLNVSSAAISGRGASGIVTVAEGDARVQKRVTTGIVGDETTQILDGLQNGDQLVVAAAPTSTAGGAGAASQPGGRLGGALGGGGGGFAGGGAPMMRGGGGPPGGGGRP
jgi:HlyD family secretion protein